MIYNHSKKKKKKSINSAKNKKFLHSHIFNHTYADIKKWKKKNGHSSDDVILQKDCLFLTLTLLTVNRELFF